MYLTRSMLAKWNVTEAAADAVLEAHQASVDKLRGEWKKELKEAQEMRNAASERDELRGEVERLQQETARAERAEAALEEYRQQQEAAAEKQLKERLIRAALEKSGVSEKILPLLMTAIDTQSMVIEDGKLANEGDTIDRIRRQWPGCFTETEPEPAGGAHMSFGSMGISRDALSRMTAEEINEQWTSVQEALRGW